LSDKSFNGKSALITGAGAGMGLAHATLLAERGATVLVQDIEPARTRAAADAIVAAGGTAVPLVCDAADTVAMKAGIAAFAADHGAIGILVNNAGISGRQAPFEEIDEDFFDRMIAVHVKSAFFASQAVTAGIKSMGCGRIINVSSMFAMKGSPDAAHYTTAKGALLGLTKALARELAPWGITVNAIAPGLVETEMTTVSLSGRQGDARAEFDERAALTPLGRLATPRDLAYAVAFLASDEAALMTGQTVSPNGGDAIVGI